MKKNYTIDWLIPQLYKNKSGSQIEEFIINAIKSKQLNAGDLIPSYRELSKINNISLSTVRRAYTKLSDSNWLTGRLGSGTFISASNPTEDIPHRTSGFTENFPAGLIFLNKKAEKHSENPIKQPFTGIGTDFPNMTSFPEDKFLEYYYRIREASKILSKAEMLTAYDTRYLKNAIVEYLNRKRGFGLKHNMLDIIKGRKSCLNRLFKILISPGDIVINTSPYDVKLSSVLSKRKAKIFTVNRQDSDFIERIERELQYTKIRAIHIRPQCSFPESYTLSPDSCDKLIELAKKYRFCIIEEDDDHEFWYGNGPYKPLACYGHDGYVVHIGALSKATPDTLALRLIVASSQLINGLRTLPSQSIETRDIIKEKAIAEMILNGDMADYARQIRLKSKNFRDEMHKIMSHYLYKYISYEVPDHGMTFWIRFSDHIDVNIVLTKLETMGIRIPYHPNNQKTTEKVNYMVMGFGAFDIREAKYAARMLNEILNAL